MNDNEHQAVLLVNQGLGLEEVAEMVGLAPTKIRELLQTKEAKDQTAESLEVNKMEVQGLVPQATQVFRNKLKKDSEFAADKIYKAAGMYEFEQKMVIDVSDFVREAIGLKKGEIIDVDIRPSSEGDEVISDSGSSRKNDSVQTLRHPVRLLSQSKHEGCNPESKTGGVLNRNRSGGSSSMSSTGQSKNGNYSPRQRKYTEVIGSSKVQCSRLRKEIRVKNSTEV